MSITTSAFLRNDTAKLLTDIPRFIRGVTKFPKNSIIHFLMNDGTVGPKRTSFVIKDLVEQFDEIYLFNIMEVDKEHYHGRRPINSKIREGNKEFFVKYRHFSKVHNMERILKRADAPMIMNYNHIFTSYKADSNRAIDVLRRNMGNFVTLWDTAINLETDAVQFIPIRLPRLVREIGDMKVLMRSPTQVNLLTHTSTADVYLYSLMQIVYAEEYLPQVEDRNIVFRIIDGINHVDIPYKIIAKEIDKKSSTPEARLNELYDVFNALIDLRVAVVEENEPTVEIKAKAIKIDTEPTELLNIEGNIESEISRLISSGAISEGQATRARRDMVKYKSLKVGDKSVEEILTESKKDGRKVPKSTIPKFRSPIGDSVRSNVVQEMDKKYINETLEQDIVETLVGLSRSGHMILSIRKEDFRDAGTRSEVWSVQTRHINGEPATLKFTIPKANDTGTFKSGGVEYRMGRQRPTLPIVKIGINEVAMTSSNSKIFATVGRAATDNLGARISKHVMNLILDEVITVYLEGTLPPPGNKYGFIEGALATNYSKLEYNGLKLNFNETHSYKGDVVKFNAAGDLVGKENYGSVLNLLDMPNDKLGKFHSEARIKGAHVPIAMIIASWIGLDEFFKLIKVKTTEYDVGSRVDASKGPVIRFKDVKVQVEYSNLEQLLLINGFVKYDKAMREIERDSLDAPAGFRILFTVMGLGRSQYNGIASVRTRWIDPITGKLLVRQGYPTDMTNLFLSVNKLLSTSEYNRETDGDMMYIRGYDRIVDLLYREIMVGMNEFDANTSPRRKLSINPRAVEIAILSDALVSPAEDTSPMGQISNQTRIGYGGTAGRSDRSLMARHRAFDENDLGVISEAGTDDGKSGTILNTPANPNFDSIYGTSSKDKDLDYGNVLSINSLHAPFILHDEMKRVIFSRIQSNSMVYAEGYRLMPVYTGAGLVAAHQVKGNYTFVADDDGEIFKVTDKFVEVKYNKLGRKKYKLGRGISRNSGKMYPKKLITDYKRGDKFKEGAVLIWDTNYFSRSFLDRDQVDLYNGAPIFVAVKEEGDTYEDGSATSRKYGDTSMSSRVIHSKTITATYKNGLELLVGLGDKVSPNTPVAVITPEGVELGKKGDTLDFMSRVSPKAEYSGEVVRIEVNYIGDPKEATKGIRALIRDTNKVRSEEAEYTDEFPTGEIINPTYINQEYLDTNSVVITLYIEHLDRYGVGDKSSDCNALKTVNGYSWEGRMETLDGIEVHEKFAGDGMFRRVVTSAFSIGMISRANHTGGLRVCDVYHNRIKL